jgi:POT family proton-dependent oligopeptide transporter
MVGQLYAQGDARRDGAVSIFYMGINLGAFLSAFVCGTLGERVGWHWGFGAAAVGMLAGLALYVAVRGRVLGSIGDPPAGAPDRRLAVAAAGVAAAALAAVAYHAGLLGLVARAVSTPWLALAVGVGVLGAVARFLARMEPAERGPTITILVFMLFNAVFWLAFEQAGSSLNLFTDTRTDRVVAGFEIPTTWFQSVNAGLIFLLAPLFAAVWSWLGRRGRDPSQAIKIALGLAFLGVGYLFMVAAGRVAVDPATKASVGFIVATYFWHTVGELCLSPTGLSYVTKTAPERYVSLLMGVWFVSSFLANLGGGLVAAQVEAIERGDVALPWRLGGQADFFMLFVVASAAAALLAYGLAPLLTRLARNAA